MDPRDDDIQFDFFEDEPATTESQAPRGRLPRRGGRGTGMRGPAGPPRGLTPILRLLALIAILVAVLVFFGLLIQSCASTSKKDAYKSYMAKVALIAQASAKDGSDVANAMITPGAKVADLETKLARIAEAERTSVTAAQHLDPPGPLRDQHENLIEALQLRVNGIQGLARAFGATAGSKNTGSDATLLATWAQRLLASDVDWDDLFKEPATIVMQNEGVTGVAAPPSRSVANPELVTQRSMAAVLQRLRSVTPGGTPTGVHGTNIVATKVLPSGQTLLRDQPNTIVATQGLAFVVTVHDGGDSQQVGIQVTLTLQKASGGGTPITKTKTLDVIDPGQDKDVTFRNIDVTGLFAEKAELRVNVAPVVGEKDATNNKATYPVLFSVA
ncbi:MAG: hypothetical protein ACJ76I_15945 [Gaiellaceae bacterium]